MFSKMRTRLERLERQAEDALAERDQLLAVLDAFRVACTAAGTELGSAAADAVPGVPPSFIVASRSPRRPGGEPVVLEVAGMTAVAVIGPGGDPATWMPAIASTVRFTAGAQVTSVERAPFPEGLLAVAAVPAGGGLTVRVAEGLGRHESRLAVSAAIRAARRTGWRDYRAGAISAVGVLAMGVMKAVPVKWAASGTMAAAGAVAAVAVLLPMSNVPYQTRTPVAGPRPVASARPSPNAAVPGPVPGTPAPGSSAAGQAQAAPATSQLVTQQPSPLISVSVAPSPSQSSALGNLICVNILGIRVCL